MANERRMSGRTGVGMPDSPPREWPKSMHTVMTSSGHEKQFNDREMTADTVTVANGQTCNYVMGLSSCRKEHYRDIKVPQGDGHHVLRYTWLINGIPVHVMIFNSDKNGKMGRLVREGHAEITEMEWKVHKK